MISPKWTRASVALTRDSFLSPYLSSIDRLMDGCIFIISGIWHRLCNPIQVDDHIDGRRGERQDNAWTTSAGDGAGRRAGQPDGGPDRGARQAGDALCRRLPADRPADEQPAQQRPY